MSSIWKRPADVGILNQFVRSVSSIQQHCLLMMVNSWFNADDFALQYFEFLLLLVDRRIALKNEISGWTIQEPSSSKCYLGHSRIQNFPTGKRDPELEVDHATLSTMRGATSPGLLQGAVLGHRNVYPNYNDVLFWWLDYSISSYIATSRTWCENYSVSEQLEELALAKEVIKVCVMNWNLHAGRGTPRHAHFNFTEAWRASSWSLGIASISLVKQQGTLNNLILGNQRANYSSFFRKYELGQNILHTSQITLSSIWMRNLISHSNKGRDSW